MSNEWAEMLKNLGIEPDASELPEVEEAQNGSDGSVQLHDLSDWRVVDVTGADAASFLQGQFCNDLLQVSVTRAQITGYCTPKGRLLALPVIVGTEDGFRLLIKSAVMGAFIKRLSMFIMRSDVTLSERTELICSGVVADSAQSVGDLQGALGTLPFAPLDVATSESSQLIRWHDDHVGQTRSRFVHIANQADSVAMWNSTGSERKSFARWRAGDISAGIPSITEGTSESFVPQMINLQLIDALSFTKGCYPGQEIVARMQYLGKLKRHMRLFKLPGGDAPLVPGAKLSAGDDAAAGEVIDAVTINESGAGEESRYTLLIAVVKVSSDASALSIEGRELQALDVPYNLPSLSDSSDEST
ncbi:MAG: folate-binding protein YgfZ [Granulosicoccus sp.]